MYHVYLQETDGTWTPSHSCPIFFDAQTYAANSGINFLIEDSRHKTVFENTNIGRFVQRRNRKA